MNLLLKPDNHLFELARRGQRLPHIILAIVLAFVFVIVGQIIGGALLLPIVMVRAIISPNVISFNEPETIVQLLTPQTAPEQATILILGFGPIFLVLWAWLALFEKRPFWTIGLERLGMLAKYLRGALVGLAMFVASVAISAALGYITFEQGGVQSQGVMALGGVLVVFLGWLVQGAAEEALARGWLMPVIGARYRPVLGLISSSIVFAVLHSLNPNLNPIAIVNLFLFGVFTALYALYEGSLWGVFSIHTVWNWAQGNLFGFEVSGQAAPGGTLFDLMEVGPDVVTGGPFGPEGGLAVTVVLVVGCGIVWWLGKNDSLSRSEAV
jgi:membrane protease YdiL (CAAX protease family)